jgi:aspartate/methionine/tyrosine aminotransferase
MIAKRAEGIPPFLAMEVLERAQALERQGHAVIHLELGEPDLPTPPVIEEAARRALRAGETHYTHSLGTLALREAIAEHTQARYGVTVSPDRIVVGAGTSPLMLLVFAAILDPGDQVVLSNPGYACYPNFVRFAEGEPALVRVEEDDGFQYRPEAIRAVLTARTKAIVINSPANPTGTLLSAERMGAIADLGPLVLSDEIYHGLVYEGRERSILEFTDQAVVFNGFSKAYAMTGWRLGYAIVPPALVRPLQRLAQNFFISPNAFVQAAGVAALREAQPDVARHRAIFDERRRCMLRSLRELGFGIAGEPTGAFYVLANARRFARDSVALASEILERARVGVAPGVDFGSNAEGYLRFSYANALERIAEAMQRLERFLAGR